MSSTIKYYQSKDGKFKVRVPNTRYQTKTAKSLIVLQDVEKTLDETISQNKTSQTQTGG